jgi:hypothetical protein
MDSKQSKDERLKFVYEDKTVYEWDQSLDEVNIYITPSKDVSRRLLDIQISSNQLKVGLKGLDPYINEQPGGVVKVDESTWTIVDGEINIVLHKMNRGEVWDCALRGVERAEVDLLTKEKMKKKLMVERFQEEV